MSLSREVIAEIHCVPVDMVQCKNCKAYKYGYCDEWDERTMMGEFCGYWKKNGLEKTETGMGP